MPKPLIVVETARETRIRVCGWPGSEGQWMAYTRDEAPRDMRYDAEWDPRHLVATARRLSRTLTGSSGLRKGRVVTAYGWHRFRSKVAVANLHVHVESKKPLLITHVDISTDLITAERYAVRSFLLACAVDIADELQEQAAIDHGWVDWRVPEKYAGDAVATAPGFVPVKTRSRRRRSGADVILRRS